MGAPDLADTPVQLSRQGLSLRAVWLAGAVAALALYAATVAPDVLMMDSGEYQWSTWLFPNNPLPQGPQNLVRFHVNYLMVAKVFGLLVPVGSWFLRINLFSAVAASIAAGNVCWLTYAMTRSRAATALTWLALVLGQTFWMYSVIAEVLSMQAALVSTEILLLYLWVQSDKWRWLWILWLVNGFAAGTHVQSGLASPIYLVITLAAVWQGRVRPWQALACAGAWLAGYSPYVILCARQVATAGSWESCLGSATTGQYGGQMWRMNPKVLLRGLLYIALNSPTGLALLSIPGLLGLQRLPLRSVFKWGWLSVLGVNLLFTMTYNVPDQQSFFVPVFAIAAPLIGLGASLILRGNQSWVRAFMLAVLVIPIYAALPALLKNPVIARYLPVSAPSQTVAYRDPYEFYLIPWKMGRHNERRYIEEALAVLPEDGLFLGNSTINEGMRAVQIVEARHPRLRLDSSDQSLADNLVQGDPGSRWLQPVYLWAPRGSGIPQAIGDHCRLILRDLVWEALPPEDTEGFLRDLQRQGAVSRR